MPVVSHGSSADQRAPIFFPTQFIVLLVCWNLDAEPKNLLLLPTLFLSASDSAPCSPSVCNLGIVQFYVGAAAAAWVWQKKPNLGRTGLTKLPSLAHTHLAGTRSVARWADDCKTPTADVAW